MFGLNGFDPITHATLLSLSLNIVAFVWVSKLTQVRLQDRIQADHFVDLRVEPIYTTVLIITLKTPALATFKHSVNDFWVLIEPMKLFTRFARHTKSRP